MRSPSIPSIIHVCAGACMSSGDVDQVHTYEPFFTMASSSKTYIVEHLDPELGAWSELEYLAIARESQDAGAQFCLSSLPPAFKVPEALRKVPAFKAEARGVEELYASDKSRVCLLDPAAASDLSPEDGDKFDAFLFGGILGAFLLRGFVASGALLTVLQAMILQGIGRRNCGRRASKAAGLARCR